MKVLLPQEKFYCKVLIFVPLCSLEQKRLEKQEQIQLYYFLEKFDEPPKRIEAVEDSITAIFDNADLSGWEDEIILKEYLLKIDVTLKTYKRFCNTGKSIYRLGTRCLFWKIFFGISFKHRSYK